MAKAGQRIEIKINNERYPVEPPKLWAKMKELRRVYYRRAWEAYERGDPLFQGYMGTPASYMQGMGNAPRLSAGIYFNLIMRNREEQIKSHEAVEAYGWTNDLCSTFRAHLGLMLRGFSNRGGAGGAETRPATFSIQSGMCNSIHKGGQAFCEYTGIPLFNMDAPAFTDQDYDKKTGQRRLLPELRQYDIDIMADAIEWMEKVSGRKWDDEAAIEATKNSWNCKALKSKIYEEMKNIPSPWDLGLLIKMGHVRYDDFPESVAYFKELLDETRDRVKRGISARGWEKVRLHHDGVQTFYTHENLRRPADYGAVFASGGNISGLTWGMHRHYADGHREPVGTLEEEGREIRTRQDFLEAQADMRGDYSCHTTHAGAHTLPEIIIGMMRQWRTQAAIIHMNRGCHASTGYPEAILVLQREGYPVTTYEASHADIRDWSDAAVFDRYDSFMESLGLSRLGPEEIVPDVEDIHAAGNVIPG